MGQHTSRYGQRVDRVRVYEDHDKRRSVHPITGEEVGPPGIPILLNTPKGKIVKKSIRAYTIKCPDCKIAAKYDEKASPICPKCGLICVGPDAMKGERLVRDAKAAGRIDNSSNHGSHA